MKKLLPNFFTLIIALSGTVINAQNVGISATGLTPATSAGLDVNFTNKGVLIPRVILTATTSALPITLPATSLMVYNTATAGVSPNNVTPGYYYWNGTKWVAFGGSGGNDWSVTGNAGLNGGNITTPGTNFLGTTDAQNIDFRTNNITRARISSLGEFFVGTINTVMVGDLMNGVSNVTFPWAVNGYSNFDGAGVYGTVQTGATIYPGVQGEYDGTNTDGTGVRGLYTSPISGTSFQSAPSGVEGSVNDTTGNYRFGVRGLGGRSIRSGGVLGDDFGVATGALGYYASNGWDYAVYGFGQAYTTGVAGGRLANPLGDFNNMVGIGIYGGVMGGWIKGLVYGTAFSGKRYGVYVDGKTLTNDMYVVLNTNATGNRVASYAATSLTVNLDAKGTGRLVNGEAEIKFDKSYSGLISPEKPIIVTATPMGETKGIYIVSVDKTGFKVKENNGGTSNVAFNWIAIGEKKGNATISPEILNKNFDTNMEAVMHNDNAADDGKALWWNGSNIQFGTIPKNIIDAKKSAILKTMPVTRRISKKTKPK